MNNAESIKQLRQKYTETKFAAEIELQQIPQSTRPGWEAKKRRAAEELPKLSLDLAESILSNSVAMLLSSDMPNQDKFIEYLKSQESNTIVIDNNALAEFFFKNVFQENRSDSYSFGSETAAKINNLLYEVGIQLQLVAIDVIMIPGTLSGTVKGRKAAVDRLRQIFSATYGDSFEFAYLNAQIKQLILNNLSADRMAVVITNANMSTASKLSSVMSRVVTVSSNGGNGKVLVSEEDTPDAVLKAIVGSLSKKRKVDSKTN
jgi:hypothetical protein